MLGRRMTGAKSPSKRLRPTRHLRAEPLHHERDPHASGPPLALQLGDAALEADDLGALTMAVPLELAEQIAELRREQAHDRPANARHEGPDRTPPRRRRRLGEMQRGERRLAGRGVELREQAVRVGRRAGPARALGRRAQYAPRRPSTTGMVRAMIVRSSQIDHVSM